MFDSLLQDMARQHIQELHEEASAARIAKLARESKDEEAKPPRSFRVFHKKAMAR